jgi:hypothetical protein
MHAYDLKITDVENLLCLEFIFKYAFVMSDWFFFHAIPF